MIAVLQLNNWLMTLILLIGGVFVVVRIFGGRHNRVRRLAT